MTELRHLNHEISRAVKERMLKRRDFRQSVSINPELVEMNTKIWPDGIADRLVVEMNAAIYEEALKQVTYLYPKTWWDHLKNDHAPEWFKKRWPPQFVVNTFTGASLYPEYAPVQGVGTPWVVIREMSIGTLDD